MHKKLITAALALCLSATLPPAAQAIEAGGVRFDDKINVAGADLIANGAGVRTKFVFDVYAMTLYLPAKATSADAVTRAVGAKRIAIQLMRDVSAIDFVDALKKGLQANLSEVQYAALKPQIQQFSDALISTGEVKKGNSVAIDFTPATGTRLTIAGKTAGQEIPGDAFFNALLQIWLGDKPVQSDLKALLLGK